MTRRTTLFYCYLFLIYTFCVHLPSLNVEVFYMHLYNKEQAIKRMNQLGQLHRPFIFIINYLQDVSYIEEVAAVDSAEVLYNLNGFTNQIISAEDDIATYSAKTVPSLHWQPFAESFSSYQRSFNIVRRNILAGNSFLTNLTCRTPVETNLTLKDIYFHSKAIYKLWIKDRFTVFSPEIFVRIHQGKISPCTLQHAQKLNGEVEKVLLRLGFTLTDVPDSHLCCGSAGTYALTHPDLARQLRDNKMNALESGKPEMIVTANIGCQTHLASAGRTSVRHWIEIVEQALEKE